MSAHAINEFGCVPDHGVCLIHEEELDCSHRCSSGTGLFEHITRCDDPPPPIDTASGHEEPCIGCGRPFRAGDPVRRYEDGEVCGEGCLQKGPPS